MTIFGIDERLPSNYNNVFKGTSWLGNFTGALISNDLVLSASHVVNNYLNTTVSFNTTEGIIFGKAVYLDNYNDIAIFQLNKTLRKIKPLGLNVASQQFLQLDTSLVGFHGDQKSQTKSSTKNISVVGNTKDVLQYDLDAYPGSSGGPLLDYRNNIIGINTSQYADTNEGAKVTRDLVSTIVNYDNKKNGVSSIKNKNLLDKTDITRVLDTKTNAHLYTNDEEVIDDLIGDKRFVLEDNWKLDNRKDVYEFYSSKTGDFFYTSDYYEMLYVDEAIPEYKNNGIVFGVEDNTIHRLYNPTAGLHFYTDDYKEALYAVEHYNYEIEGMLN